MKRITLITGGARSGKSDYAQQIAKIFAQKAFIATAEPFDDEMKERIDRHKRDRDASFRLIEEPIDLAGAIRSLPRGIEITVIDCLTVWVGNCLHKNALEKTEFVGSGNLMEALKDASCDFVIVTNEVGLGIVPDGELARKYRDIIGTLNRQIAALAKKVVFMVSGIPMVIKDI